ncbi:glutamate--cysteine ligase [Nocardioides sp. CN2-186]|uniref:carboxylate-amine ligase n=1 Tax=Nocardioides tweenelious TaxID=3156607 RepID=UPI0032B506DF
MVRSLGIEEELLLVDPASRAAVPEAARVLKEFHDHGRGHHGSSPATEELDHELFRHQLETRTDPTRDAADAFAQVVSARRTAGEAARAGGLVAVASGISAFGGDLTAVTDDDRYRDMVATYGEIARTGGTCGMHVHVAIESDAEGVAVIDRIAPWLPVLLAISANSPFAEGRDTGYASWRSQVWSRWPSAGPTERFGSVEGYRDASRTLLDWGAARDPGMLYFDARLSESHPTVEVRVCDVCADPADAVLIAVLVRGLVETAARGDDARFPHWRAEALRAAHWAASRWGLSGSLVDPTHGGLRPARDVLDALLALVGPTLAEAGDEHRVVQGRERVLGATGASRQRAAYERAGDVGGVVDDLVERTEGSWAAQDLA